MKAYVIACVSTLVLTAGIGYADAASTSKPCIACARPFHPPTHGHHAKVKPGQKVEFMPGQNAAGNSAKLDANTWPGPHPGIGGNRGQTGSVRGAVSGTRALPAVQRPVSAGQQQRVGQ